MSPILPLLLLLLLALSSLVVLLASNVTSLFSISIAAMEFLTTISLNDTNDEQNPTLSVAAFKRSSSILSFCNASVWANVDDSAFLSASVLNLVTAAIICLTDC